MDPLDFARSEAVRVLTQAGTTLACRAAPDPDRLRFRCDGKGGEWATPYPLQMGVAASVLSDACPDSPYLERVFPSGSWIALDLNEAWRDMVRSYTPDIAPAVICPPPLPAFPARISPESWRFQSLLPVPQAACAARLDGSNPYVTLLRAQQNAAGRCQTSVNRPLLNECAVLAHCLTEGTSPHAAARQALHLAEQFLIRPAEAPTVARFLTLTRIFLGI